MYDDGYKNIVNIDVRVMKILSDGSDAEADDLWQYSGILIEKMRKKHEELRPEMECKWL